MRILLAYGDASQKIRTSQILGKYGIVDCFDNGRDAVLSFVNGFQTGNRYDLLVIENDLKQLDGVETALMIRKYELEHLTSYKLALIVFSSEDLHCRSSLEARHGADERIVFLGCPIPLTTLKYIAEKKRGKNSSSSCSTQTPSKYDGLIVVISSVLPDVYQTILFQFLGTPRFHIL